MKVIRVKEGGGGRREDREGEDRTTGRPIKINIHRQTLSWFGFNVYIYIYIYIHFLKITYNTR